MSAFSFEQAFVCDFTILMPVACLLCHCSSFLAASVFFFIFNLIGAFFDAQEQIYFQCFVNYHQFAGVASHM